MKSLHAKQSQILEFFKKNKDNDFIINDLYSILDIESPGILYYHLGQLERKGYIKKNPSNSRDYQILDSPEDPITYVNNYGKAKCGPGGLMLDGSPVGRIPITSTFLKFPAGEAFIVEAEGDSMEPKIYEGNMVIARKQSKPNSGDIIVCAHHGEVKIKQYVEIGDRKVLHSLNKEHPLIEIQEDDEFTVEGVVKNVLSSF